MTATKILKKNQRRKSRLCGFSLYRYLRQIPPYQRAGRQCGFRITHRRKNFDGSSIEGWRGIENSDMVLVPDLTTAVIDPFIDEKTMLLTCDAWEPSGKKGYNRCPRTIATAAMAYLKKTGIGDNAIFGPEPEFLYLIQCNGKTTWKRPFTASTVKKARGLRAWILTALIAVIGRASKGDTSPFRRLIP